MHSSYSLRVFCFFRFTACRKRMRVARPPRKLSLGTPKTGQGESWEVLKGKGFTYMCEFVRVCLRACVCRNERSGNDGGNYAPYQNPIGSSVSRVRPFRVNGRLVYSCNNRLSVARLPLLHLHPLNLSAYWYTSDNSVSCWRNEVTHTKTHDHRLPDSCLLTKSFTSSSSSSSSRSKREQGRMWHCTQEASRDSYPLTFEDVWYIVCCVGSVVQPRRCNKVTSSFFDGCSKGVRCDVAAVSPNFAGSQPAWSAASKCFPAMYLRACCLH